MDALNSIQKLIADSIGLQTSDNLERILRRRLIETHTSDLDGYYRLLQSSPHELEQLVAALVVPETWFFRDRAAFDLLIQKARGKSKSMRFLSVACSTGEEPYSIAMALLQASIPPHKILIDAIDISKSALQKAEKGLYTSHSFRGRAGEERERFFEKVSEGFQLKKEVLKLVHFSYDNICSLKGAVVKFLYDAIFFRNLLIYLHPKAQKLALQNCGRLLLPDGVLIVAPAEAAIVARHGFQPKQIGRAFVLSRQVTKRETIGSLPAQHKINISASGLATAKELANKGELKEAEAVCRSYLATHHMDAEGHFLLGAIRHARGDEQEAEECFNKTVYLEPQHEDALMYLALLAEKRGDKEQASQLRKRLKRI